ncbi:MAG: glycosyltransferase family 4 protein [Thermoproteota archaeon]
MRILIVSDSPVILTGYGVIAKGFGKYLARRGHEVFFGSLQHLGEPVKVEIDGKLFDMYSCAGGQPVYVEKTLSIVRPDVIMHIRDPVALTPGLFQAPYRFKPLAVKYGARVIHWAPLMGDPPAEVINALSEDSDLVLAPTEWSYNLYLYAGLPSNRLETLHWGVDTEIFRELDPKPKKSDLGFRDEAKLIVNVCVPDRFHKATPLLLKAAATLVREGYDLEVYLNTASGAFKLEHYVELYRLKGRVILPRLYSKDWGISSETLVKIYNVADVVASPSTLEGANMVICEALSCGTPVVATSLPVHVEMTTGKALYAKIAAELPEITNVMMVPDVEDIARKMKLVLDGEYSLSRESIEEYRRWIGWEEKVVKFEKILKEHQIA